MRFFTYEHVDRYHSDFCLKPSPDLNWLTWVPFPCDDFECPSVPSRAMEWIRNILCSHILCNYFPFLCTCFYLIKPEERFQTISIWLFPDPINHPPTSKIMTFRSSYTIPISPLKGALYSPAFSISWVSATSILHPYCWHTHQTFHFLLTSTQQEFLLYLLTFSLVYSLVSYLVIDSLLGHWALSTWDKFSLVCSLLEKSCFF